MSPEKKKFRREEPSKMEASYFEPSSGFIRFEVDVSDITLLGIFSPEIEVQGMPWKLNVMKSKRHLGAFLHSRKCESDMWSIDVSCKINLVNDDYEMSASFPSKNTFNNKTTSWGTYQLRKWEDVINEKKGFIKDDKIIVEARFTLTKIVGIRVTPHIDFTDSKDPRHDIQLLIEGEKIYVNKGVLAVHSPVFNAMFFGDFDEKNKKEIELKDVDHKEFIEMLRHIYPSTEKISDANALFLLKLADRFQIKTFLDKVEQFLIKSAKFNLPFKLNLSDQYRLVELQSHCLSSLKTVEDIQDLSTMDGYDLLPGTAKATLLDKLMKLRKSAQYMSKSPEKKKSRCEEPTNSLEASNGFIRFEVSVSDITPKGIFSPEIEVQGMPWKLDVCMAKKSQSLGVYLHYRKCESDIWSIDVSSEIKVLNSIDDMDRSHSFNETFNNKFTNWGTSKLCKWEDVINEEKGFIKDDKIIVEARFTLTKIVGIRVTPHIDFTDSDDPRHDVALVIEGEKVYVSKQILAVHSPMFNVMFFGDFDEKNKKEIELKDVDHKEFIEMLRHIYPSTEKISDANALFLLKLADRFQIKTVLDKVEQFLIKSTKFNLPFKLTLSDQYRLVELQSHCLSTLKTVEDIQDLSTMDGYDLLPGTAKATILDKVMKLRKSTQ